MIKQNKKDEAKGGMNPIAAAVTGAVIGAGVAVAGAVALKDEKNRAKVKKVLNNVRDQAVGYMDSAQKQAEDKKGKVEKKINEGTESAKKALDAK